MDYFGDLAMYR